MTGQTTSRLTTFLRRWCQRCLNSSAKFAQIDVTLDLLYGNVTHWYIFFFHYCSWDQMKARITSSRYGLYKLGYTFATMMILNLGRNASAIKKMLSQYESPSAIWRSVKTESPVIANQTSCGEQVLEFCTNRPSRSGRRFALSALREFICYAVNYLRPASVGF